MAATLQDELRMLFAKARIPTNPALAARILELAEDPEATVDHFADLIQTDAALATRLLRLANTAVYAQRSQVTTIRRAVSLLGINHVRTVSLGFQLVAHLDRLGRCPFDVRRFWQHSLLRGCLARELTQAVLPEYADEAFLIGLLQDCGILLLVQLLGEPYARLCAQEDLSPVSFFAAEQRDHRYTHPQVIAALAREWKLPERIVTHVEKHHVAPPLVPSPSGADRLWALSYLAGSVHLMACAPAGGTEPLGGFAERHLGMDPEAVKVCLTRAGETYAQMGRLLQGTVPDDLDVSELLSQANAHLTMTVESAQQRTAQELTHLTTALGEYRERAARDPLTNVLNRGALNDAIRDALGRAAGTGESVTLLFLDLDNFKRLNDTCGHQAGDLVLQGVTQTLRLCVPGGGTVGRYGGEEFVMVVNGLDEPDALALSERVLTGVRATQFPGLGLPGPVTCSAGAVWCRPDETTGAEALLRSADELMYQAKRAGKDRCCFRRFDDAHDDRLRMARAAQHPSGTAVATT